MGELRCVRTSSVGTDVGVNTIASIVDVGITVGGVSVDVERGIGVEVNSTTGAGAAVQAPSRKTATMSFFIAGNYMSLALPVVASQATFSFLHPAEILPRRFDGRTDEHCPSAPKTYGVAPTKLSAYKASS